MVTSPADVAAELMATFGIEQVSYSRRRGKLGELETHCVQTIENLVEKFGREPVYWALWVITETKHRALLVHPVVTALVETLATYPKWRDQIGSLADALDEIDAWIGWLENNGAADIALIGYGQGANQVAVYNADRNNPAVSALAVLAPEDAAFLVHADTFRTMRFDANVRRQLLTDGNPFGTARAPG